MGRSVGRLGVGVVVATSSLLLAPLGCFSKDSGGSDAGANFGGADASASFGADAGFGDVSVESLAVVVYSLANDVESLAVAGALGGSVATSQASNVARSSHASPWRRRRRQPSANTTASEGAVAARASHRVSVATSAQEAIIARPRSLRGKARAERTAVMAERSPSARPCSMSCSPAFIMSSAPSGPATVRRIVRKSSAATPGGATRHRYA